MSLFFKNPKTCMSPWKGLFVIVCVCLIVVATLLIGKQRHELAHPRNDVAGYAPGTPGDIGQRL